MDNKNKDIKEYVRFRDNGICQKCGRYCWNNGNIAHRISQSKHNIKKYGNEIIDHPYNKAWACFSFNCNDSFNIGNRPGKCAKLIDLINTPGLSAKEITNILNNY